MVAIRGRNVGQSGEVVLDRILAKKNGIRLGDTVEIVDEDFTVVGLSDQTAAATNYYTFIAAGCGPPAAGGQSRVLLPGSAQSGLQREQLAAAIQAGVPGMDALTSPRFAENSRDIIVKMIGRPLKTMIAIAALVGVVLVGLTVWALTSEQMADFGCCERWGAPESVGRAVLGQARGHRGGGVSDRGGHRLPAQLLLGDRMGDVTIAITPTMLAVVAMGTALMAGLGSILPARRVSKIDPAIAFRR